MLIMIAQPTITTIAISLVGIFFGLLMILLGWLGSRLYQKIDDLARAISVLAGELHTKINGIDGRLIRVESRHEVCEGSTLSFNKRTGDTHG